MVFLIEKKVLNNIVRIPLLYGSNYFLGLVNTLLFSYELNIPILQVFQVSKSRDNRLDTNVANAKEAAQVRARGAGKPLSGISRRGSEFQFQFYFFLLFIFIFLVVLCYLLYFWLSVFNFFLVLLILSLIIFIVILLLVFREDSQIYSVMWIRIDCIRIHKIC